MKHIHHHQRCTSVEEFQQSLTQLEDIFQAKFNDNQKIINSHTSDSANDKNSENTVKFDIADLEDAVADIEQYLAQKQIKDENIHL